MNGREVAEIVQKGIVQLVSEIAALDAEIVGDVLR